MSDTLHIVASSGAAQTVDVTVADVWDITLTANCTLTLTGSSVGSAFTLALFLRQDGTGGRTVTWPGSVTWPAGTAPTLHSGAAAVTLVTLTTVDGGSTWIGFAEPSDGATGATGAAGSNGSNGTNGTDGVNGGAVTIDYTFSTTTTDSDPGNGNLRLDNATQNLATTIRADLLDAHGTDWTAVLDSFDDSTNTVKGLIRLFKRTDLTKWLVFTLSAVATPSGYRNITVAVVGSSGSSPFSNGDGISLCFERVGDAGTAASSPLTTKGDIFVHSSSDTRLAVGSDTQVLSADSSQTTGLKWVAAAASAIRNIFTNGNAGGDFTTTSGSFGDMGLSATVAAAAGDFLLVSLDLSFSSNQNSNVNQFFQMITTTGSNVVRQRTFTSTTSGNNLAIHIGVIYTVVSGDISGGNVAIKVRFATNAGTLTVSNSSAASAPQIAIVNLLH